MAGYFKGPMSSQRKNSELESKIKMRIIQVLEYGQAITRLGDTMGHECMSYLKARLQSSQTQLEFYEKEYGEIVRKVRLECLSENSHVPVISIAELSKFASAEAKALDDVTALQLSLVQLTSTRAGLVQELQNIREAKENAQTGPIKSTNTMEDDSEIQDLKDSIKEHADKIREHKFWVLPLSKKAWVATEAANLAAKSDIEVPGIGRWSSLSAPTTVTDTLASAPTTATTAPTVATSAPIIVNTAQVKVADIPSAVKAAAKDPQASVDSNVVATVPRSTTAIMKVDSTLSSVTLCAPQKQYTNVKSVEQNEFVVGDIGWFPVLRPSLCESSSDIHTEFGYICAKSYPLIIVERLQDCMLGLIISTSNGNGLRRKGFSIKSRSALLVTETSRNPTSSDWGQEIHPRQMLRVKCSSKYTPPTGAYVDMLNVIMVPYDARFQKKGSLMMEDAHILQQMRLSAVLAKSGAGKFGKIPKFWMWFAEWYGQWCKAASMATQA